MGSGAAVTIAVAKPEMPPLDALTVLVKVPGVLPAVNNPDAPLIAPPPATTDHVGAGVMGTTAPVASLPTAVYWMVALVIAPPGFGVTVMVASTPGAVTITVANPEMDPLVALTVLVNVPAVRPAVNKPEELLMAPPPATIDHVGVMATTLPLASLPTATNDWVAPICSVGFGVTVIVFSWALAISDDVGLCSHATAMSTATGAIASKRSVVRDKVNMCCLQVFRFGPGISESLWP